MFNSNGIKLNLLAFGITISGLVVSIIALIWTSFGTQAETSLRSVLLLFNFSFVSAASFYVAAIYYFYEREKSNFTEKFADMVKEKNTIINNKTNLAEIVAVYGFEAQNVLRKFLESLDEAYSQYCLSKNNLVKLLKQNEETNAKDNTDSLRNRLLSPEEYFQKEIKNISNRFFRNTLDHAILTTKRYLECKGYYAPISLAVKRKDVRHDGTTKVVTFFRDYDTFLKGEREIEQKEYSIEKNSDFAYLESQCKDRHNAIYIMNDIQENKNSYMNESSYCPEYYDATIVVPIANSQNIFGYLACDTKKPGDQRTFEVFDKEGIGKILLCSATSMAIFWHYSSIYLQKLVEKTRNH